MKEIRNQLLHKLSSECKQAINGEKPISQETKDKLLDLVSLSRKAKQNNSNYENKYLGIRIENEQTLQNQIKTNADVLPGGLTPDVNLKSQIFNKVYKYEEQFFPNGNNGENYNSSDFVSMEDLTQYGYFDKGIFRVERQQAIIKNRKQLESYIGGSVGGQIPANNSINLSAQPLYVDVKNEPIFIPLEENKYENMLNIARFGYDFRKELYDRMLEGVKKEGLLQSQLTFYGSPNIGFYGLTNMPEFKQITFSSVEPNDVAYLFDDTREAKSNLTNKSIFDIVKNGNYEGLRNFVRKINLIKNHKMGEFVKSSEYEAFNAVGGSMVDGVLMIPDEDYINLQSVPASAFINGLLMSPLEYIEKQLNIKIMRISQFNYKNADQYGDFAISNQTNKTNLYKFYDKTKIYRGITADIARLFDPAVSNMGLQLDEMLIGSSTGCYTFESIVGFDILVPQD